MPHVEAFALKIIPSMTSKLPISLYIMLAVKLEDKLTLSFTHSLVIQEENTHS